MTRITPHEQERRVAVATLEQHIHRALDTATAQHGEYTYGELFTAMTTVMQRWAGHLFREELDETDEEAERRTEP